ncbi:fatty acid desaturase [uncultured Aliiroseovarius sp.]|uniref:fatty acid desaturase n=1 Tax=uncultured Aliiroseovarius sp. TaxID=1658783 RepID=UPI00260FE779|nr:fatty acid desaturase [uncultured Aliiroseovarius sp.]
MTELSNIPLPKDEDLTARDWVRTLAKYREPSTLRSSFELAVSAVPFLLLWALAWYCLSISPWLSLGIALFNAAFLLRLFAIQHDCGHGSVFKSRTVSDWVGRVIGVVTLTPYDVWKRTHSIHHNSAGNLGKRGIGDIMTLTVDEYNALSPLRKFQYRLYRNPITLFGFAPGYLFLLQNRLPFGLMNAAKYWVSAMATNIVIVAALVVIWYFGGLMPVLLIFLPTTLLAATAGMWLFYIQHQFEETHWKAEEDWQLHDAALHGSSHYVMPAILQWFSANIGIHHVHHLHSRIPFYRLTEVLKDHEYLSTVNRMTIRESLASVRLHLWDEKSKKLMSFTQAQQLYG